MRKEGGALWGSPVGPSEVAKDPRPWGHSPTHGAGSRRGREHQQGSGRKPGTGSPRPWNGRDGRGRHGCGQALTYDHERRDLSTGGTGGGRGGEQDRSRQTGPKDRGSQEVVGKTSPSPRAAWGGGSLPRLRLGIWEREPPSLGSGHTPCRQALLFTPHWPCPPRMQVQRHHRHGDEQQSWAEAPHLLLEGPPVLPPWAQPPPPTGGPGS